MAQRIMRAGELLRSLFWQYSALYFVLALIAALGLVELVAARMGWFLLLWIALALATLSAARSMPLPTSLRPLHVWLILGVTVGFALLVRALAASQSSIPPGYDYGFYKAAMQHYEAAAPLVPESDLPSWLRLQFEPGLLVLHETLFVVAGLDASMHLRIIFPILSAGLTFVVYAVARSVFGTAAALTSAAIYAASGPQFLVYLYLYEKNVIGLALAGLVLLSLHHERHALAGLLLGSSLLHHRPTFLVVGIAVAAFGGYDAWRRRDATPWAWFLAAAIVPIALMLGFRTGDLLQIGRDVGRESSPPTSAGISTGSGGAYLTLLQYIPLAAVPLGLAVASFRLAEPRIRRSALWFFFGASALLVLARFVFYNRFLIMLDFAATLLAGAALLALRPPGPNSARWRGAAIAATLVILAAPTLLDAAKTQGAPVRWMTREQLDAIAWIGEKTPANATILGGNVDAPFLMADSGRRTYGPGLFDDPHSTEEWQEFISTTNPAVFRPFLDEYRSTVFVYHGDGHGAGLGTAKFVEPSFILVYEAKGVRIWRNEPGPMQA